MSGLADMARSLNAGRSPGNGRSSGNAGAKCLAGRGRRGAVLLEVIVSMALLIFGMAVVGVRMRSAMDIAQIVDVDTRAMMLVDTLMAELDAGLVRIGANDDEVKGNFLNQAPGFTWRIGVKKADVENLFMLTVDIGYNEKQVQAQIDDPLAEASIEDEGVKIIETVYRLYAKPADVNMERDYGLTQDDLKSLFGGSSSSGSSTSGGSGTDGTSSGTSSTTDLTKMAEDLGIDLTQFSFLFDGGSFDPRELTQLPADQFTQLAALLSAVLSQGGTAIKDFEKAGGAKKLKDLEKEAASGQ